MPLPDENRTGPAVVNGTGSKDLLGSGVECDSNADSTYGSGLFPQHQAMLRDSGIPPELARARGYRSVDVKKRLRDLGISAAGSNTPGLLFPLWDVNGDKWGSQYRPDQPRTDAKGKAIKYETPVGQPNRLDVPPSITHELCDPGKPLFITEGSKKADAAVAVGLVCVALLGVYAWRGKNSAGGTTALACWESVALKGRRVILAFDNDVMRNPTVRMAMDRLAAFLKSRGADVEYCNLPDDDGKKIGLDDYLASGHTANDLMQLVSPNPPAVISAVNDTGPDEPEAALHRKHWRLAALFAAENQGKSLHVIGLGWHYWDGKRWARDNGEVRTLRRLARTIRQAWVTAATMTGEAQKEFRSDIACCETSNGSKGVLELARVLNGIAATVDEMDADPFLVNTTTGTLDLRTRELHAHNPTDRLTNITKGGYRTDSTKPVFAAFLARVLPDDEIRLFVQRLIGLALLGIVREHVLAIFTGSGQNGKTTLIEAVGAALGDYYLSAPPALLNDSQHQAHPTELMTLMGKRLVTLAETDHGAAMSVERMKRLTGGDRISARLLYRDFVEFTPSHTPIMVTNHLPQVPGDDPAVWRRLRVVPFDVAIPDGEKDAELPERLQLELDGILTWAVDGYADYVRRGGLDEPTKVKDATGKYHADSDLVGLFLADTCNVDGSHRGLYAHQMHLWDAWQKWCHNNRRMPGRQRDFVAALVSRKYERTKTNAGQVFYGLALID